MSNWRVSLVFRNAVGATATSGSQYNWTESYYTADDIDAPTVAERAATLLLARRNLLTPGWRVSRIRFSQFPSTRTAFSQTPAPTAGVGRYPITGTVTDEQAYDRLIIGMVCASGKGRALEIGGIGSDVVDAGGVFLNPGNFSASFGAFGSVLAQWFAVKRATKVGPYAIAQVLITAAPPGLISPSRPALVTSIGEGAGIVGGMPIRVSGVQGMAYINGSWRVYTVGGGPNPQVQLDQKRGVNVIGAYAGGGKYWGMTFAFDRFASGTATRGTSRKTGGSIDRPRGRRSVRRS